MSLPIVLVVLALIAFLRPFVVSQSVHNKTTYFISVVALALLFSFQSLSVRAQSTAYASPKPDERFKADILLVVAHSEDETGDVAAYLARAVFDQHRRVAVVCVENGHNGSNNFGPEWGKSLGLIRPMEAQHALASLGVTNFWVLNAPEGGLSDNVLES